MPMANKYGQTFNFSGCTCATCAYSDPSDKRNGKIYCQKDKEYVNPTWVCVDHPDRNRR